MVILGMPSHLEPGGCATVVITTTGNIWGGFTYSMRLSAVRGLAFDAGCSRFEKPWNGLTGRTLYRRITTLPG